MTDAPSSAFPASRAALGALLAGYALLLYTLIGAVPGGSDNSGYFNEARLFARGRLHAPMRTLPGISPAEVPYLYVPLGFRPAAGGAAQMVPTYPPGLPLLLVVAAKITGWRHAGDLVLLLHSLAGIALTFALGRLCGLPGGWSLLAAALLAASPLYLFTSLQALSDVPATAWAVAAVVAAWNSRRKAAWGLAAGACLAVGFLIRPTNILIAAPVLIAVGRAPRRWVLVALGALPGLAVSMAINHAAYGDALQSGYGAIGNEFHAGLVPGTLAFYVRWLPLLLSPVVVAAPALLAFARPSPPSAAILATWFLAFLAFYSPYRWTHEQWWFLRFVLPAAPALIVGGLAALHRGLAASPALTSRHGIWVLPVLLAAAAIGVEAGQTQPLREAWSIGQGEMKYGRVSDWLHAHVPANAVLVVSQSSGALYYYTGFTLLRHEEMNAAVAGRVQAAARSEKRPLLAVLFPFEQEILKKLPGTWTKIGLVDDVTVWRCDPAP